MSSTSAELSSMAATVEELTHRLARIADAYTAAHRDDLVGEVQEVERSLNAALRRLNRMVAARGA
jgi:hypothetical protein